MTVVAACWIKSLTAGAWDIIERWDALTCTMVEPARCAMKSWAHDGIARSIVPTRYHDGIVFHAGTPDFSGRALRANARWVDARTAPWLGGRSLAKHEGKRLCLT